MCLCIRECGKMMMMMMMMMMMCVCVCVCVYAYPPKTTLVFHPQFLTGTHIKPIHTHLPTHHILTYSNTLHGIKTIAMLF